MRQPYYCNNIAPISSLTEQYQEFSVLKNCHFSKALHESHLDQMIWHCAMQCQISWKKPITSNDFKWLQVTCWVKSLKFFFTEKCSAKIFLLEVSSVVLQRNPLHQPMESVVCFTIMHSFNKDSFYRLLMSITYTAHWVPSTKLSWSFQWTLFFSLNCTESFIVFHNFAQSEQLRRIQMRCLWNGQTSLWIFNF